MEIEFPQVWYVNKLHEILKQYENDDSKNGKLQREWFGEILHMMLFDGMEYEQATGIMNEKIERMKAESEQN